MRAKFSRPVFVIIVIVIVSLPFFCEGKPRSKKLPPGSVDSMEERGDVARVPQVPQVQPSVAPASKTWSGDVGTICFSQDWCNRGTCVQEKRDKPGTCQVVPEPAPPPSEADQANEPALDFAVIPAGRGEQCGGERDTPCQSGLTCIYPQDPNAEIGVCRPAKARRHRRAR